MEPNSSFIAGGFIIPVLWLRKTEAKRPEPQSQWGKDPALEPKPFDSKYLPIFFFLTDQSQMIENKINSGSFYKPQFFILEDYFVIISFLLFFSIKMSFLYDTMLIVDGRSTFLI